MKGGLLLPIYKYKAINHLGEIITDKIESATEIEALEELERREYSVISIKNASFMTNLLSKNKVDKSELSMFFKNLSYLIKTGIPIHRAIEIVSDQSTNIHFKSILVSILKDIKNGQTFSSACEKHPKTFTKTIIEQLKTSEEGGFLEESLVDISISLDREIEFNKKIKNAMTYPVIVLIITIGIVFFMLLTVVPKISNTLNNFDAELPLITKVIINISDFILSVWYLFLLFLIGLIILFREFLKKEQYRLIFDTFLLKVPILSNLIINVNAARISRTMSSMIESGVPIEKTLESIINLVNNKLISKKLKEVKNEVIEQGFRLSDSFQTKGVFPVILSQITSVGEESGNLGEMLKNLSDNLEENVINQLDRVSNIVNPLLMIFVGGVVGVVVISMFLPMFTLIDQF